VVRERERRGGREEEMNQSRSSTHSLIFNSGTSLLLLKLAYEVEVSGIGWSHEFSQRFLLSKKEERDGLLIYRTTNPNKESN